MTLGASTTPTIVTDFWNSLKATDSTVACPRCNAQNLEVRRAGRGRNTEYYVLHHDTCIRVFPGNSQVAQVVRQLAQDEADAAREAQDAATIAQQDAEADAALFAEEDIISRYTRKQAIEDGALVDVSATARGMGFTYPVALTAAVWAAIENIPERLKGTETNFGRLWDVLWLARFAGMRGPNTLYTVIMNRVEDGHALRNLELKFDFGHGDEGEPVITILLPGED